ncbi:MAG TPA: aldo/keto reductase [Euzebyales bacterium]|nr:aldo/keto reductase [Euzebyales bacterium]
MMTRILGAKQLEVSTQGLGCMGMSFAYQLTDDAQSIATIHRAIELGITFFETADVYRFGHNERLLGRALAGRRDGIVVATKFGVVCEEGDFTSTHMANGRPEYVRRSIDASLARLGMDHVDLYYQQRADPDVPIEETVGAMAELVCAGKVRHLGLSDAQPDTIRRAVAVHPITALQSEWSVFSRDIEVEVLGLCRPLGVGLVPYSLMGRGLLAGLVADPPPRSANGNGRPRIRSDARAANLMLVDVLRSIAAAHHVTPGQVALGWLHRQGDDVVPVAGAKRRRYLEQNVAAIDLDLSAGELAALDVLRPASAPRPDVTEAAWPAVPRPL